MSRLLIDIGGTKTRYTVFGSGEFVFEPIERKSSDPGQMIEDIAASVEQDFDEIAVSSTGTVSGNRAFMERLRISGREFRDVSPEVGEDVVFENDTNAAALAESRYGAGEGFEDVLYITFSTGISAGYVQDGELVRGDGNFGKIGHYPMNDGEEWEEISAGKGVPETLANLLEEEERETDLAPGDSVERLYGLAESDEVARDVVERLGCVNAKGVATAALSYDPEVIVVGGSIADENPEKFLDPVRDSFEEFYPESYSDPVIAASELGEDAELYGASLLES